MRFESSLCLLYHAFFVFFFQAEDGIRDLTVTGVQTCALPISIQWWRRTNGRAFCSLVTIGSVTLPRYGRTGRRVRGDEGILTNVQRLPRPPRPALACRPDDSTPTRRSRPPRTDRRARRRCLQLVVELESQRAGVVPLTRPGAVAPHAAQSHRVVATRGAGAARRLRGGPRGPAAFRRRRGREIGRAHVWNPVTVQNRIPSF